MMPASDQFPVAQTLSEQIAQIRADQRRRMVAAVEASSLSRAEIARRAGVYPSHLANLVNGDRAASPETIDKIIEAATSDSD